MTAISIMIEGQNGLNWPRWKGLVKTVDRLGFAGLFRSDHFTNPNPPDHDSLELMVSLAYLADNTTNVHFGALVAPVSFREPIMYTRQIAALDALSGGRAILGIGAGWQDREHTMFGYELGDVRTRMDRYAEALEVSTLLLRSQTPVSFEGKYYQLREAQITPRISGTPIMVGGSGPKRTLPLAARYADIWNAGGMKPEAFAERNKLLDELLEKEGRPASAVRRTLMAGLIFGRDQADFEQKLRQASPADIAKLPYDELLATHQAGSWAKVMGTPEMVREQIAAYKAVGVEELMLQWEDFDDLDGLSAFAEAVLS
jgi:Coenzyme F420-dependent N5,N10-methylene tetrahydromethanopterin reductase and related flavin-dependent oxidoreductases